MLVYIDLFEGHPAEALAAMAHLPQESSRLMGAAIAQYELRHTRESDEALDQLAARVDGPEGNLAYRIATVHSWRGERERAFERLSRLRPARSRAALGENRPALTQAPRRSALHCVPAEDETAGGLSGSERLEAGDAATQNSTCCRGPDGRASQEPVGARGARLTDQTAYTMSRN